MNFKRNVSISGKKRCLDFDWNLIESVDQFGEYCHLNDNNHLNDNKSSNP